MDDASVPPSLVGEGRTPCSTGAGGVGSIPAKTDAQNVPSFRRWRFEMKLSPFFASADFWSSMVAVVAVMEDMGVVLCFVLWGWSFIGAMCQTRQVRLDLKKILKQF